MDSITPAAAGTRTGWCVVEFYGVAQLIAGSDAVTVALDGPSTIREVLRLLATNCPALVGPVLDTSTLDLADGYVVNRNGRDFLRDLDAPVTDGDRLLILASIAGGAPTPRCGRRSAWLARDERRSSHL